MLTPDPATRCQTSDYSLIRPRVQHRPASHPVPDRASAEGYGGWGNVAVTRPPAGSAIVRTRDRHRAVTCPRLAKLRCECKQIGVCCCVCTTVCEQAKAPAMVHGAKIANSLRLQVKQRPKRDPAMS
eukprot:6187566-Pleurochrysis_carterae.AAC.4